MTPANRPTRPCGLAVSHIQALSRIVHQEKDPLTAERRVRSLLAGAGSRADLYGNMVFGSLATLNIPSVPAVVFAHAAGDDALALNLVVGTDVPARELSSLSRRFVDTLPTDGGRANPPFDDYPVLMVGSWSMPLNLALYFHQGSSAQAVVYESSAQGSFVLCGGTVRLVGKSDRSSLMPAPRNFERTIGENPDREVKVCG